MYYDLNIEIDCTLYLSTANPVAPRSLMGYAPAGMAGRTTLISVSEEFVTDTGLFPTITDLVLFTPIPCIVISVPPVQI
jgi:hypothetical protein